jgi:putative mycofactocin binding protein MftB
LTVAAADIPGAAAFDLDRPWMLSEGVALRPERFGALAYDFRTRRLSMLKDPGLVDVVRALAAHSSAREACTAIGVDTRRLDSFRVALDSLARSGMIRLREST